MFITRVLAVAMAASGMATDENRPLSDTEVAYIQLAVSVDNPRHPWSEVSRWGPRAAPALLDVATSPQYERSARWNAIFAAHHIKQLKDVSGFADAAVELMPKSSLLWAGNGLALIERANKPSHGPAVCDHILRVMKEWDVGSLGAEVDLDRLVRTMGTVGGAAELKRLDEWLADHPQGIPRNDREQFELKKRKAVEDAAALLRAKKP